MISSSTKWFVFAGIVLSGVLVYLLAPVITPFLTGALLAYLGDPLVDWLETKKLSRTGAVLVTFIFILLIIVALPLILLPMLEQQVSALAANLPRYIDWLQNTVVPFIAGTFHIDSSTLDTQTIKETLMSNWRDVGGFAGKFASAITKSGVALAAWLANLVLVPVVTFYLLRDWDVMVARIRELLPRQQEPTIVKLAKNSDEVLGQFLRGQLAVMVALGTIYTVGLWIVGLDLALLVGMIAGLVSFVPYLGFIVGIVLAGIAAMMQFGDAVYLFYVAIVFGVGQILEGMVLTPLLVGDKIGLHPVAVIFAVMAGGQLFGFVGILLALPVAAVVVVILRHMREVYTASELYGNSESSQPPANTE